MSYEAEVLDDSPDLYWELEDVLGTTAPVDSSGNGRGGTVQGTLNPGFGESNLFHGLGTSVGLNGTGGSNYIKRNYDAALDVGTGDFTFELLVRSINGVGDYLEIAGRDDAASGNGVIVYLHTGTGTLRVWLGGTVFVGSTRVSDGLPHHIAVLRESGVATLYLDGIEEASGAASGNTDVGSGFKVGGIGGLYQTLNGEIGHVAWYKHSITEARVLDHVAELPPAPASNKSATIYIYENVGYNIVNNKEANGYIYEDITELTMRSKIGIPI